MKALRERNTDFFVFAFFCIGVYNVLYCHGRRCRPARCGKSGASGGRGRVSPADRKLRAHRVERLKAPNGWLSLIGLEWLKEGNNTLGSAKDNSIVQAKWPAHLGMITLDHGKRLSIEPNANAKIDGAKKPQAELIDDTNPKPTVVASDTVNFYLVQRGDRWALRIKDSEAPTRKHFVGIDYFDIDPGWRIEAKWEPTIRRARSSRRISRRIEKAIVPGAAVFEHDGKTFRVEPSTRPQAIRNCSWFRRPHQWQGDLWRGAFRVYRAAGGWQSRSRLQQSL